jgi:flagellar hook-associated protein 3 FlgL
MSDMTRVTQRSASMLMVADLEQSLQSLTGYEQEAATGKQINQPSDNPAGTSEVLALNTQLGRYSQYSKNISDGQSWLNTADTTLGSAITALNKVQTDVLSGANASASDSTSDQALSQEVLAIKQELLGLAGTTYNNRPIFAGTYGVSPYPLAAGGASLAGAAAPAASTTITTGTNDTLTYSLGGNAESLTVPAGTYTPSQLAVAVQGASNGNLVASINSSGALALTATAQAGGASVQVIGGDAAGALGFTTTPSTVASGSVGDPTSTSYDPSVAYAYAGSANPVTRVVAPGQTENVSLTGPQVFGSGSSSVFALLDTISQDLANGNTAALSGTDLSALQSAINTFTQAQGNAGAVGAALATDATQASNKIAALQDQVATLSDADEDQVATNLDLASASYQAALETTAKVIQPSLAEFLS